MKFCKKCCYSDVTVNLNLMMREFVQVVSRKIKKYNRARLGKRKQKLKEIKQKKNQPYDCVIPVSGGKDSYFQTHIIVRFN